MRQGKKTSGTYISWDKAIRFLNCTAMELYEKCNSGDLPVYSSDLLRRYHPASHFYTEPAYADTLHWFIDVDVEKGKSLELLDVDVRHSFELEHELNLEHDIQKRAAGMMSNYFNDRAKQVNSRIYPSKYDLRAMESEMRSLLPRTRENNFGTLMTKPTGILNFTRFSPNIEDDTCYMDTDSENKALGRSISSRASLMCIVVSYIIFSKDTWLLRIPNEDIRRVFIFLYSKTYKGQNDGLTMIFSPYPNDEIIEVPPVEAIDYIIRQRGMTEKTINLIGCSPEIKMEIFRLANDYAAKTMCKEKIFPQYFDRNFIAKKLPDLHEISHIADKLVFNQADIDQLYHRDTSSITEDGANNESAFQGAWKIPKLVSCTVNSFT